MSGTDIQNIRERIIDQHQQGNLTTAEANVKMVRDERFHIITRPLRREVRTALNAAVKAGILGHLKQDGLAPEAYYHPNFKYLATVERNRIVQEAQKAISIVCGRDKAEIPKMFGK